MVKRITQIIIKSDLRRLKITIWLFRFSGHSKGGVAIPAKIINKEIDTTNAGFMDALLSYWKNKHKRPDKPSPIIK